jgi:hypothetical protein
MTIEDGFIYKNGIPVTEDGYAIEWIDKEEFWFEMDAHEEVRDLYYLALGVKRDENGKVVDTELFIFWVDNPFGGEWRKEEIFPARCVDYPVCDEEKDMYIRCMLGRLSNIFFNLLKRGD